MLNAAVAQAMQNEFKKIASEAMDLAGLGVLAAPHLYKEVSGKDVSKKTERRTELGGLATLAAGTVMGMRKKAAPIKPGTPQYRDMMQHASLQANKSMPQMQQGQGVQLPSQKAQSARASNFSGQMQGGGFQPPKVQKATGAGAAALQKAPAMRQGLPMAGLNKVTGGGAMPGAVTKGIGGAMGKITNWGSNLVKGVPKLMGR